MKKVYMMCSLIILLGGCSKNTSRGHDKSQFSSYTNIRGTEQVNKQPQRRQVSRHHQNSKKYKDIEQSIKIKMVKKNGVYHVPIKINEVDMEFIFDTGASDIVISSVEALFLYKHKKITHEDILGVTNYQIADGSISEGTVINLKTVQLGNRILYDVKASVIDKIEAPLLLGQSALSQFGKISINYKESYIEFID